MRVRMDQVVFDAGTQVRAALDQDHVASIADAMSEGATLPPIALFHDGNQYYIGDGFHRFMAAQRLQWREIDADVKAGTKDDALWFALAANREQHALKMSAADKKHAIVLALRAWPGRSQTQIAEQVGCTVPYVTRIRQQVFTSEDLPDRVIGKDGKSYPAQREASAVVEQQRDERREAVAAAVRAGRSSESIVEELRVRPSFVADVRREMGIGRDVTRDAVAKRIEIIRHKATDGFTTRQIAAAAGVSEQRVAEIAKREGIDIPADRAVGKIKRHDSNRIVAQIVADAENLTEGVDLIDFSQVDRVRIAEWLASLHESRKKLGAFIQRLVKEQQKHGEAA